MLKVYYKGQYMCLAEKTLTGYVSHYVSIMQYNPKTLYEKCSKIGIEDVYEINGVPVVLNQVIMNSDSDIEFYFRQRQR